MQAIIVLTLFLQRRLHWCLCTCAGRRLARSNTLLKCLRSGPKDEKGKIALRTAAGRQAQANRQTSAGLAILLNCDRAWSLHACASRGATGPPPHSRLLFTPIPSRPAVLTSCFSQGLTVFRRTHSFLAVSLQTSRSLQPSHSLRCVVLVAESCLSTKNLNANQTSAS
jgi:hypothetical protein